MNPRRSPAPCAQVLAVLQRYGPAEALGLDEVWVDATQVGAPWSRVQGPGLATRGLGPQEALGLDEVRVDATQVGAP